MGRTAIPHVLYAIAAMICGTVLAALGHPDASYVAFGLAGVGGVAGAAVTIPSGAPGTAPPVDLMGALNLARTALAADSPPPAPQPTQAPPAPPAPPVDVPPPPAVVTP